MTSGEFKDSFLDYFKGKLKPRLLAEDFWTKAFFAPGINLEIDNDFSNSLSKAVDLLAADLITEKYPSNVEVEGNWSSWSTQQRCLLLEKLITHYSEKKEGEKSLSEMLLRLDAVFHLSECTNAEIKFRWHTLCLQSHADFIVPHTVNFLSEQGRMKYVRPLYRLLVKVDPETAKKTFRENENAYHPIARKMIDVDLRKCS